MGLKKCIGLETFWFTDNIVKLKWVNKTAKYLKICERN